FVYGDIESEAFDNCQVDVIVCASVIQYFADLRSLMDRLRRLLQPEGEIHVMDSPLYSEADIRAARARSADHFTTSGYPRMASYYHHHTWKSMNGCRYSVLHDPESLAGRIRRWL